MTDVRASAWAKAWVLLEYAGRSGTPQESRENAYREAEIYASLVNAPESVGLEAGLLLQEREKRDTHPSDYSDLFGEEQSK